MSWTSAQEQTQDQQQIAQSIDKHGDESSKSLAAIQSDISEIKKSGTRNTIIGSIIGTSVGVIAGYLSIWFIEWLKKG